MTAVQLGRLEKVELRDIWVSEATSFTPWLAREENLAVLAEALGFELELEAQEKSVGPFRADILCKELGSSSWVLIENQLERTDHAHLGQLLTYASGLEAVTIVWIAARFTEEHRSTLDWLNKITDDTFRFFGLEVELWRIGGSPAAPKFNIVSKPNDWSRSVAHAARVIDESELSDTRVTQREYWEQLHLELDRQKGPISGNRKAQPQSWMTYPVGRSGFMVSGVMIRPKKQVRAELYISNEHAKSYFFQLREQRDAIESELGFPLFWDELPNGRDKRISVTLDNADPENRSDWSRQHAWLANQINALRRVFENRVRALRSDDWQEAVSDGD